jgi:hypothetical protein
MWMFNQIFCFVRAYIYTRFDSFTLNAYFENVVCDLTLSVYLESLLWEFTLRVYFESLLWEYICLYRPYFERRLREFTLTVYSESVVCETYFWVLIRRLKADILIKAFLEIVSFLMSVVVECVLAVYFEIDCWECTLWLQCNIDLLWEFALAVQFESYVTLHSAYIPHAVTWRSLFDVAHPLCIARYCATLRVYSDIFS